MMELHQRTTTGIVNVPIEPALQQLMKKTGYQIVQENGQRKFGGPPPGWELPHPPTRGCEIFIGKIPRDIFEDELIPVFQRAGKIYEFRLMMDFSGSNRGYAFCTYCQKADAKRAVKEINNFEIKKGRFLGVCSSVDNCRLFIGGIPKMKVKDEILTEMSKVTEGVVDVIVYPSAMDKSKNRGFAFVEYVNHRAAAMARRKLIPGRIQLWGHSIAVDWAEPEPETDEDIMATVRILYVRNLMLSTTEETLKATFEEAVRKKECIERVKKLRDYAFIHFKLREDALRALDTINGTLIEGSLVEVVLAKPVDKNEHNAKMTKSKALSQVIGYDGDNTFALYGHLLNQNGRPLNQAELQGNGRARGMVGTRSAGGTKSYSSSLNIRRHPVEILEEVCQKSNLGSPAYQLHSAVQRDPVTNVDNQLFLYKVSIPAFPAQIFHPNKLCRTVEEAKIYTAEYILLQLGIPIETSEIPVPPITSAPFLSRQMPPTITMAHPHPHPRDIQVPITSNTQQAFMVGKMVTNPEYPSAVPFEYPPHAVFTPYP